MTPASCSSRYELEGKERIESDEERTESDEERIESDEEMIESDEGMTRARGRRLLIED